MNKLNKVKILVLLGVVFVSFSSILTKTSSVSPLVIATYRLGFATLLLTPVIFVKHRQELKNVSVKTIIWCSVSGVFLALHFATWMTSIRYTSIASSATLVNMHPVFIVFMTALIFKEKYTKPIIVSIIVTLIGSTLISGTDLLLGNHMLFGDLLAIAGGFFVACYMLIGRYARKSLSVNVYTFLVYGTCTLTLLLMDFATNASLYPYPLKEWGIFISLAIFCTLMGHSIFNWALGYLDPALISTAILGEPVLATLWAFLIFKEPPTIMQVMGGCVIILGIYMYVIQESKERIVDSVA